jgi:branched-subunit amino acid aminotransferase/4-amino-4-deoxychorismate lyase
VRKGTVFTPPLDGRILPGVTRATVIELARAEGGDVVESAITLEELRQSEEVFLTNSIRGIERVGAVDGIALHTEMPLTQLFATALKSGWEKADDRSEAAVR